MANGNGNLSTAAITPLPSAMTAAAFLGLAWYFSAELLVRISVTFTRRGLYFWSIFISATAIILHSITITLINFGGWSGLSSNIVVHVTWAAYVIPQSFVLYSRLHLVLKTAGSYRWVLYMIIANSVFIGGTTVISGIICRTPERVAKLGPVYLIWSKFEVTVFFVVETIISLLYIYETRRHLKSTALLSRKDAYRKVLTHLIWINVYIICLDIALMGVCFAGLFFLQGHFKVAVYAIKLRTECAILDQLRSTVKDNARSSNYAKASGYNVSSRSKKTNDVGACASQASDIQMVTFPNPVEEDHEKATGERIRVEHSIVVDRPEPTVPHDKNELWKWNK
ncbi:hypothetical protein BDV95DRAFT_608202 [Massariosphaeria phaeospora]|uniref:DUF7703 domain-containing protein n=1 Tax=Massariosphaeria phaeospora TaxID=100035 RepID=A0A7C8M8C6_9PLEO|nr:hypothetical protein BDV95DRAFT_608202 [Massariosphaeria phaeospora]